MTWKLGMVQMEVAGGKKLENLARAEARIAQAAEAGAQVVVLPECLDLGWTDPSSLTEAEPIPSGEPCSRLIASATRHQVYLCAGLTEKADDGVYNSAILVNPAGEILLHHRKINELDIGREFYAVGDRLGVVDTELGRIGVMICADAFAPGQVISRTLGLMGTQIILSPSAWAISDRRRYTSEDPYGEIWRENYRPVSEEYDLWIAGVSNVGEITGGPWKGRRAIGASLLYGPGGTEIMQGPFGVDADTILYASITLPGRLNR